MRKLPLVFANAVATLTLGAAMCVAQTSSNTTICAEREITIEMLIEAYGTAPNQLSTILDNNAASLVQARAACNEGRIGAAVAVYDRIIGDMTVKK